MSERRLAAVLSADAVGYSRLMADDDAATVATITAYRGRIRSLVDEHGGRVVDAPGDNLLAEFPAASEAVRCALAIHDALDAENATLPEGRRMPFRMGLHVGELIADDGNIYGDGVNVAARLEALAEPGGICASRAVVEQARGRVDVEFEDLGDRELKNIPEPVRVFRIAARTGPAAAPAAAVPAARSRRVIGLLPFAIPVVLLASFAWWMSRGAPFPSLGSAPDSGIRSIAVLPLDNMSGDPGQEYFADGMTEALIADLARIKSLRVISRTSVMQYKGVQRPLPEIAQELGADAIVEGSVLRAGDRVRVTAQLIRAATDEHLWSESYTRDLVDVLDLQAEVARAIADQVRVALSPEERQDLEPAGAVDPRALEAYLRGRHMWAQRGSALRDAVAEFRTALEIDPAYASAWGALAEALVIYPFYGVARWDDVVDETRAAAERALQLDPRDGSAENVLATIAQFEQGGVTSERRFRRAIELAPNDPTAYARLARMYSAVGRAREAEEIERQLRLLDPLSPVTLLIEGLNRLDRREYEAAAAVSARGVEAAPDFQPSREVLVWGLQLQGRTQEAERQLDAPMDAAIAARARVFNWLASGKREGAAEAMAALPPLPDDDRFTFAPSWEAAAWVTLGEPDRAVDVLERHFGSRPIWNAGTVLTLEPLDPLVGHPRYDALVARLKGGTPH